MPSNSYNSHSAVGDVFFYALILASGLSFPVASFGGDSLTVFDFYVLAYGLGKLVTSGYRLHRTHWASLLTVYAVYLVYLSLSSLRVFTPFSFLLLIKHFENLLFLTILADRLERSAHRTRDLRFMLAILLLIVAYQILYNQEIVGGIGVRTRLGLPFMEGTSSNPAGFFLGALLVYVLHYGFRSLWRAPLGLATGIVALYALALTVSRTNGLAFLVVVAASILVAIWRSRLRWPLLIVFGVISVVFFTVVVDLLPTDGQFGRVIRILQEPGRVFQDRSFNARRETLWPMAIAGWLDNGVAFVFGKGLGHFEVVDGTVHRLLGEQGIVGLLLFAWVWYVHYLRRVPSKGLAMLLLFTVINGITAETMIVSYRSIQLYLVILVMTIYSEPQQDNEHQTLAG